MKGFNSQENNKKSSTEYQKKKKRKEKKKNRNNTYFLKIPPKIYRQRNTKEINSGKSIFF